MAAGQHALLILTRHARPLLALCLFVGLALPPLAALLRPVLPAAVAGMLFLSMLRVDWPALSGTMRRPRLVAAALAWLLAACPLGMAAVVAALPLPEGIAAALVLMAAAPPITSAPAMALLLGLDMGFALALVAAATLAAPFTLPLAAGRLAGQALALPPEQFALRVALLVLGTLAAALVVRRLAGPARIEAARGSLDGALVLLLLVFAIALMDGVTAAALDDPGLVAALVAGSFAANLVLQAVSAAAFARLGRQGALTFGLAAGNRNMALVLAALPADADPHLLLWFAVAQFPIYLLPALSGRAYRRLLQPGRFSNGAPGS